MLQALATLAFSAVALSSLILIALLLRNDWASVLSALGYNSAHSAPPLPIIRAKSARRAIMVRVEVPAVRQRAAA